MSTLARGDFFCQINWFHLCVNGRLPRKKVLSAYIFRISCKQINQQTDTQTQARNAVQQSWARIIIVWLRVLLHFEATKVHVASSRAFTISRSEYQSVLSFNFVEFDCRLCIPKRVGRNKITKCPAPLPSITIRIPQSLTMSAGL